MILPYDYARCEGACDDPQRCARHTSPSRPDGPQTFILLRDTRATDSCEHLIDNRRPHA